MKTQEVGRYVVYRKIVGNDSVGLKLLKVKLRQRNIYTRKEYLLTEDNN